MKFSQIFYFIQHLVATVFYVTATLIAFFFKLFERAWINTRKPMFPKHVDNTKKGYRYDE